MGARVTPFVRAPPRIVAGNGLTWPVKLLVLMLHVMVSFSASDSEILLKFKESLHSSTALGNWNASTNPCGDDDKSNWEGVLCSKKGTIKGLQLESMGLMGLVNIELLVGLPSLRTLSMMNNSFEGPMPNIKNLGALKSVYLSNNHFSGEIPDNAFSGMRSLKKLYLSNNNFIGKIPLSLVELPRILELGLDGNRFQGMIPDFPQEKLKMVNLSNNELEGPIPERLSKMDMSPFLGNKDLCGKPLDPCKAPMSASKKPSDMNKPTALMIVVIVIVLGVAVVAIGAAFVILHRCNRTPKLGQASLSNTPKKEVAYDEEKMETAPSESHGSYKKCEQGKLSFVRDDRERFELHDLLRSSAEVLRGGTLGFSYKVFSPTGQALVVKRYRQMNNVGREDFQEHMRRLERLKHPNLLPLVAYYYRREEKLLIFDHVMNGSLAGYLHGRRTADRRSLDWPTRLKIIKGVAKGLDYLHNNLPSLSLPHGHLKSSNVLINNSFKPLLTDYALAPLINQEHAQQFMVAYKSPEYEEDGIVLKKTDVWNFGILILEILTGKLPGNYLPEQEETTDLADWANSVVSGEWTGDVFDKQMGGTMNCEGEMLKLLQIGLECCDEDAENRWGLKEVVEKIEELRERDDDEDFYSSFASEARDIHLEL